MSAAADARGLKRVCVGCGIRFYDFNKRPIKCPSCDAEFSGEIKLKARRGRVPAAEAIVAEPTRPIANDQFEEVEATADTVSLEEVVEDGDDADEEEALEGGDLENLETLDDELEEEIVKVEKE
jgi:uncharacterized protein (TIGR02300 family)